MPEKFIFHNGNGKHPEQKETLEQKIERLRPTLEKSMEVANNPDRNIEEGLLNVTRERKDGTFETIHELIVLEITEDGPNLAAIDEEGYFTASATMLWIEIVNAEFEYET